jgi:uncharacterized UPF0160 family protein
LINSESKDKKIAVYNQRLRQLHKQVNDLKDKSLSKDRNLRDLNQKVVELNNELLILRKNSSSADIIRDDLQKELDSQIEMVSKLNKELNE